MDREQSWNVIECERLRLAALLETLSQDEWNRPSLCAGWRVRDVAAHVALTPQPPSVLGMLAGGVRAGGRFHKLNHDIAVRHAALLVTGRAASRHRLSGPGVPCSDATSRCMHHLRAGHPLPEYHPR
jgi:uncharacterized protein (TIGR03083 family)